MYLGIDPGWTNLGYAIVDNDRSVASGTLSPKDLGIGGTVDYLESVLKEFPVDGLVIERYVAYEGKHNAASEYILEVIGALIYFAHLKKLPCRMVRAIDWKPFLAKHLFKTKGFKNSSKSFDKQFSVAAAKCILSASEGGTKIDSHQADAACLSYLGNFAK